MRKKSLWEKVKVKIGGSKTNQDWVRRQFMEISRFGGNPIVMKMGN